MSEQNDFKHVSCHDLVLMRHALGGAEGGRNYYTTDDSYDLYCWDKLARRGLAVEVQLPHCPDRAFAVSEQGRRLVEHFYRND